MLIYPLRPKSTPSDLLTRGSTIPSVSTNLTEHHLTQLPAHSTGSSAAEPHHLGCQRPCCASCLSTPIAKLNEDRARLHPGIAELGTAHTELPSALLPSKHKYLGPTTPFLAPDNSLDRPQYHETMWLGQTTPCISRASSFKTGLLYLGPTLARPKSVRSNSRSLISLSMSI
ncbi:hypothetical protein ACSBR2_023397 [Camellia fascicularis]